MPQPTTQERYKVEANTTDFKPSITCKEEFLLVDKACSLLEKVSGMKLHCIVRIEGKLANGCR